MRRRPPRRGQAIVESLIVVLLTVAAFLFFQDFATGLVARLLLDNAAANAARADAVGFNDFHRAKSMRVGLIPVSGRRLVPDGGRGVAGAAGELALVRTYLQARDWPEADGILDYLSTAFFSGFSFEAFFSLEVPVYLSILFFIVSFILSSIAMYLPQTRKTLGEKRFDRLVGNLNRGGKAR